MIDHAPPASAEAELSVLGAMLIDADAIDTAAAALKPEDFYREGNRRAFAAMLRVHRRGDALDPVTLAEELRSAGALESAGGLQFIASVLDAVPTSDHLRYHAAIVADKARLRRLAFAGQTLVMECMAEGARGAEVLARAESLIGAAVAAEDAGTDGAVPLRSLLMDRMQAIEERSQRAGDVTGLETGLADLDAITAGYQPGDLVIVAARPSQGKTAFALNAAAHAGIQLGVGVGIFSLEMSRDSLTDRLLVSESRVNGARVRTGNLRDDDYPRLAQAAGLLNTAPILIDDRAALTIHELRARAFRMRREMPELGLVVVDYLQLMAGGSKTENRQQEVSEISRGLKALAKDLDVPVMALSQLSRAVEARPDKRPVMSDLRECLPVDEWVYGPSGPVRLGSQPSEVVAAGAHGVTVEAAAYVPKRYNAVFEVRSQYGTIRATARHLVLTGTGWKQVRHLVPGRDVIAAPLRIPHARRGALPHARLLGWLLGNGGLAGTPGLIYRCELDAEVRAAVAPFGVQVRPRRTQKSPNVVDAYLSQGVETGSLPNPLMAWIRSLGLEGKTAHDKLVPSAYLGTSDETHAELLRGLWEADGTVTGGTAKYTTASEVLARQVAWLLLTLGVRSTVNCYDGLWEVRVSRADGERMRPIVANRVRFAPLAAADPERVDPAPAIFVELLAEVYRGPRRIQRRVDGTFKAINKAEVAAMVEGDPALASIANSPYLSAPGLGWGRLESVRALPGEVRVADLQVPGPNNFVANGIVAHNSGALEQDADLILFLYRPEYYYGPTDKDGNSLEGIAEVIVGKQRNGATGTVQTRFHKSFMRFENARQSLGGGRDNPEWTQR